MELMRCSTLDLYTSIIKKDQSIAIPEHVLGKIAISVCDVCVCVCVYACVCAYVNTLFLQPISYPHHSCFHSGCEWPWLPQVWEKHHASWYLYACFYLPYMDSLFVCLFTFKTSPELIDHTRVIDVKPSNILVGFDDSVKICGMCTSNAPMAFFRSLNPSLSPIFWLRCLLISWNYFLWLFFIFVLAPSPLSLFLLSRQ